MRGWGRGGDGPQRALGAGAWGALAATCRPVHSEPQLPHLQAGRCPCVPAGGPPLGVGGSAPRACLQGLRVWAPAAGGGPSPRRPRVLLWTWGDGSTSRPHQGTGAPPGAGGRAITVGGRGTHPPPWPCPGAVPGRHLGRTGLGGGGRHDLSPLASVSPPVQWGAAGSPFTRSVGGFEVRMPDSDGVLASGARPAAEEAAVWGGPVLAEGSHWC